MKDNSINIIDNSIKLSILIENNLINENNIKNIPYDLSGIEFDKINPNTINKVIEIMEYLSIPKYIILDFIIKNSIPYSSPYLIEKIYSDYYSLPSFMYEDKIDEKEDIEIIRLIEDSSEYGNIEWIKFLIEKIKNLDKITLDENSYACYNAAENGNVYCLKLLRENNFSWDERTMNITGINNNIECFKYAYENYCPFSEYIMNDLIEHDSYECFEFLYSKEGFLSDSLCLRAAQFGNFRILKFCYERNNNEFLLWNDHVLNNAAYSGNLECLKFAHENGCSLSSQTYNNALLSPNNEENNIINYLKKSNCPKNDNYPYLSLF